MPRLAKRFTVIAVDSRGIGGSTATASGYDAANMAEVETGLIPGSVHYLVEDQPETVAELIERYASLHSE